MAAAMKALVVELEHVACATFANMTWPTWDLALQAAARVCERVHWSMALPRLGASGMCCDLVWEEMVLG
jgi:hypothetical protein